MLDLTTRDLVEVAADATTTRARRNTHWLRDGRIYTYSDASDLKSAVAAGLLHLRLGVARRTASAVDSVSVERDGALQPSKRSAVNCASCWQRARKPSRRCSAVDYDLTSTGQTPILDIGSVIAPQLSPDGRFVGGYDNLTEIDGIQQGAILVVDLDSSRRYVLNDPSAAWGFKWSLP